jgi:large subunit ribosomal protein L21
MYAIVKTGGKQYRVEEGKSLLVERLPVEGGGKLPLQPLLYVDGETVVDGEELAKVSVEARVLSHERGPKLRIVKFKPKRGYKRRTGHRQDLTRIEVTGIKLGTRRASSKQTPKPVAAEASPGAEAAAGAEKPARARARPKPAAEAAAGAEKPARAKPAAAAGTEKPARARTRAKPAAKPDAEAAAGAEEPAAGAAKAPRSRAKPAASGDKPAAGAGKPARSRAKPAEEKPAAGEAKPAAETKPAAGESTPEDSNGS